MARYKHQFAFASVAVLALSALALSQQQSSPPAQDAPLGGTAVQAAAPLIRILSPEAGAKLQESFINVRWQLTNPGAAADSAPSFRLQLDDRDPVTTSDTEYTFTGLAPGEHTLLVELIDANQTPVPAARAEVRFVTATPVAPADGSEQVEVKPLALQEPPVSVAAEGSELPAAGGMLPLISVLGFGALLGGVASALKRR